MTCKTLLAGAVRVPTASRQPDNSTAAPGGCCKLDHRHRNVAVLDYCYRNVAELAILAAAVIRGGRVAFNPPAGLPVSTAQLTYCASCSVLHRSRGVLSNFTSAAAFTVHSAAMLQ